MGVATVSTLLEANKLARTCIGLGSDSSSHLVHEETSVVGCSDASWHVDEKDRLKEDTLLVWLTDILGTGGKFYQCDQLAQWKLARVARSSNSAELQTAADAEGELSYIRLS